MELSEYSHDEILSEVNRRLDAGCFSPHTILSRHQRDWMARFGFIRSAAWVVRLKYPDTQELWYLSTLIDMIESGPPMTIEISQAFACNTTYYGRKAEENHHPQGE